MNKYIFLCFALGIIFSNANELKAEDSFFPDYNSIEVVKPVPIRPVLLDSEDDDDFIDIRCPHNTPVDEVEASRTPYTVTFSVWCNENYQFVANMLEYEMRNKSKQFYGKSEFFGYDDIGDNCLGSELAEVFPNISVHDQTLKATAPFIDAENCILEKCESSFGNNELFTVVHHLMQIPSFKEFKCNPDSKLALSISTADSPTNYLLQVSAYAI